jgi:hypothetical protein
VYQCYSSHFIGFKIEGYGNDICLPLNVAMHVRMQDLNIEKFNIGKLDLNTLKTEDKLSEIAKFAHLDSFICMVCKPTFKFRSHAAISEHLFEDKTHKYKMEVFNENL